jgi:carbon-monoxide dehydrogenase medium subunit
LCIGALTPIRELETSPLIQQKYPVIAEAASTLGSSQVRNRATVGGNLCNASPAADMSPALMVLNSKVKLVSRLGERIIPLSAFFVGPGKTVLQRELLTEIIIPPLPAANRATYLKHSPRRAMDMAIIGVAVFMSFADGDKFRITDARIALGAVAPTPIRAPEAEALLSAKPVNDGLYAEVARAAANGVRPIDDVRASAAYRKEMVPVFVRRAVEKLSINWEGR